MLLELQTGYVMCFALCSDNSCQIQHWKEHILKREISYLSLCLQPVEEQYYSPGYVPCFLEQLYSRTQNQRN